MSEHIFPFHTRTARVLETWSDLQVRSWIWITFSGLATLHPPRIYQNSALYTVCWKKKMVKWQRFFICILSLAMTKTVIHTLNKLVLNTKATRPCDFRGKDSTTALVKGDHCRITGEEVSCFANINLGRVAIPPPGTTDQRYISKYCWKPAISPPTQPTCQQISQPTNDGNS